MRQERLEQFEEFVRKHQHDIVNFEYRLVGSKAEAEDLAQEAFIKAYKNFDSIKDSAKAKSWLYSIARNVAIDFFRKHGNRTVALDDVLLERYEAAHAVNYEREVLNRELSRELAKCVEQLNRQDRIIVKLLYYEGFSYAEIGTLLNMNENTLKSRLHRARKALFELLRADQAFAGMAIAYA